MFWSRCAARTLPRAFFTRALRCRPAPGAGHQRPSTGLPRVIDEHAAGSRHVLERYANNVVEADHGRLSYGAQGDAATEAILVLTETTTAAAGASTAAESASPNNTSTPGRRPGHRCSPAATSTRAGSRPGRSSSAPASNGSPTPSTSPPASSPPPPAPTRPPGCAPPCWPASGTTRRLRPATRPPQPPAALPPARLRHRRRRPALRAHRAGRGRPAPGPIRRPTDRAAHKRPGDHQPPRPGGAAPARPHRLGHRAGSRLPAGGVPSIQSGPVTAE